MNAPRRQKSAELYQALHDGDGKEIAGEEGCCWYQETQPQIASRKSSALSVSLIWPVGRAGLTAPTWRKRWMIGPAVSITRVAFQPRVERVRQPAHLTHLIRESHEFAGPYMQSLAET